MINKTHSLMDPSLEAYCRTIHLEQQLLSAAYTADNQKVNSLLQRKVSVHTHCSSGKTPLHYAVLGVSMGTASMQREELIVSLLEANAVVDAKDTEGNTPLMEAASQKSLGLARLLIQRRAAVNIANSYQSTPLHCAVGGSRYIYSFEQKRAMIDLLVEARADIHARDSSGSSILDIASKIGDRSTHRYLKDEFFSTP